MEEINALLQGFGVALSPFNLLLMFAGVVLGIIIGVLPGLGGANGVAILLPLTFTMAQQPGGRLHLLVLRGAGGGDHDHLPLARRGGLCAAVRAA